MIRARTLAPLWAALAILSPRSASADVSSSLAVGGGYGLARNRSTPSNDSAATVGYSLGVGSSPIAPVVLGGLVRGTTFVGLGTDLGLAIRGSNGGFARGDWGVAIDAGVVFRPWSGGAYGEWPLQAVVTLGAPWGLQLALGGQLSSISGGVPARGFFATLEIDLLRLTVMRQGTTEIWWPNPAPAGGHEETARF